MVVYIVLGSDKTTVSVGTGNVEYWPLYLSIGNLHNSARRGHRNGVVPIGFLVIPKGMLSHTQSYVYLPIKGDRVDDNSDAFRIFKKHLFHKSIARILQPLKAAMTTVIICLCPDGHYRRIIYDLGGYIADYPEQVLLTCIVSGWCPK